MPETTVKRVPGMPLFGAGDSWYAVDPQSERIIPVQLFIAPGGVVRAMESSEDSYDQDEGDPLNPTTRRLTRDQLLLSGVDQVT